MTTQPEALLDRLSDEADLCRNDGADDIARLLDEAAAELRRLHAELEAMTECAKNHDAARTKHFLANQELLEALEKLVEHFEYYMGDNECRPLENARAALAKATGEMK